MNSLWPMQGQAPLEKHVSISTTVNRNKDIFDEKLPLIRNAKQPIIESIAC